MRKHLTSIATGSLLFCATVASAQTTYPDATASAPFVIQDEQALRDAIGGSGSKTEIQVTEAQIDPDGYGSKSTRYLASVWFQQPFTYAGHNYHVAFIKLREIDATSGEPQEAHSATVRISAITYRKSGDEWEIVSRQTRPFTETGTWGDAQKPDRIGEVALNQTTTALLAPTINGGQGHSDRSEQVMAFDGTLWSSLGSLMTGEDNDGACNHDGDFPEGPACWSYTGTVQAVPGSGRKLPDLLVVRTGTTTVPGGDKPVPAGNVLYTLKDGVYSSPNAN